MVSRIPFDVVQQSLYKLLAQGQSIPVYDSIPTGVEAMPYIVLGEFHGTPVDENKTTVYHAVSQQLHVWSRQKGKQEVNGILDDVIFLLTRYALTLSGYTQVGGAVVSLYQVVPELYADKTGAYHGILVVEWVLQQDLH